MGKLILTLASNFEDVKKSVLQKIDVKSDLENIIIVPDRFSLLAELSVFKQKNIKCMFKTSVMPITKLATTLLEQLSISFRLISSDEEGFLIRRAIWKVKDSFCCFSSNLSFGMCDEIAKTIAQLKSCKISYEDLKSEHLSMATAGKIADIKLIYQEYENMLTDNFDGAKMLATFEKNIEKMTFLSDTNLFFVGFDSFTTQIFEIIKLLKTVANQIVVGGYYHYNQNNKRVFETDIFEKFKIFETDKDFLIEHAPCTLLPWQEHINKNLFANRQSKIENAGHVSIYSSEDAKQEMQFVAGEILKSIKQKNMRFGDFAVAHAKLAENSEEFEIILKENGINYFFDTSQILANTTYAKFITGFYSLILSDFDMTEVKNFFSSLFVCEDLFLQSRMLILIEKYLIEKDNFKSYGKIKIFDEDKEDFLHFSKIANLILTLANQAKNCLSVFEFINVTKSLIETFLCQTKIADICQKLESAGEIKQQKIYLQLIGKVEKSLESINNHLSDEKVSLKEFYDILSNAFLLKKISTVPISGDCVFVGDATDSFYGTPKVLFVMGATYDSLPKTIYDAGLINDDNISELKKIVLISPTTRTINKRNKFKLLTLLSKPSEELVITYESFSKEGRENLPASFVYDLQNMFTENNSGLKIGQMSKNVKVAYDSFTNQSEYIVRHLNSLSMAKEFMFKHAKDEIFDKKIINTVYEVLKEQNFISEKELDLFCENVQIPKIQNARQLFFKNDKTKLSQLERYFSSPFKHFISYGLCLSDVPTGEIQKTDIGNLIHFVAETFISEYKYKFDALTARDIADISKSIIKRATQQSEFYKFSLNTQNKTLLNYLTYEADSLCNIICDWQKKSNFVPKHTEKEFRSENYFEKQKLTLTGRVDRIDEFDNYFTIIDYKTGKVEFNTRIIYTGQKLQLLIYADIYEQMTGKKCAGVFYFPIKKSFEMQNDARLQGAFMRDEYVIFNLDNSLSEENPSSTMINATLNKSQSGQKFEFNARTGTKYLQNMISYAKKVCENAIDEILGGHIDALQEDQVSVFDAFQISTYKKIKQRKISVDEEVFKNQAENTDDKK